MKLIELKKREDEKIDYIGGSCIGLAVCKLHERRANAHFRVIPAPLKVELQQEVFSLNSETGLYIDASEGDKKILGRLSGGFFHEFRNRYSRRGT